MKTRQRVIYFRITEDEFSKFAALCEQEGARSVSDLTRKTVLRLINEKHRQEHQQELMKKIENLESLVMRMSEQLESIAASAIKRNRGDSSSIVLATHADSL
jgi:uncharacterized protein with PIN domain